MMRTIGNLKSIFLILITLIAVSLFIQTRSINIEQHTLRSDTLLRLKNLEVTLEQDVMQVSAFMLAHYDSLVETRSDLLNLGERLLDRNSGLFLGTTAKLDQAVNDYWQTIQKKLELMEYIKSRAAVVRNGLQFLPTAVNHFNADDEDIDIALSKLLSSVSRYALIPNETELEDINNELSWLSIEVSYDPVQEKSLSNILFHIEITVHHLNALAELKTNFFEIPSSARFKDFSNEYETYYTDKIKWADRFSFLLLTVTVIALAALTHVLRSLDAARHKAEIAWDRLRDAVENLSEAFALFDRDGRLILHNHRWGHFYPWLKEHLKNGIQFSELETLNAEHVSVTKPHGEKEPQPTTKQNSYIQQLNDNRWYIASDNQTSDGGMVCARTDITQTKLSEMELKKLSRALEQSPASVIITDTHGVIEYVNPKFESITGYSAAEVVGKNPKILKSGSKSPEQYKKLWEMITSGKEWHGQFHNRHKNGSLFWESASISPIRGEDGKVSHFIAVKEDITKRKLADEELRMNATVFETTSEGIMITDSHNLIKSVNPAFTHITGYEAHEVMGKSPTMLNSGRHDHAYFQKMWYQLDTQGCWSGEVWNRRKGGEIYPEWLSLVVIKNSDNSVKEYVAVFSDITRRKQDEEHIRKQAHFDALTGLPNRFLLFDRLDQAIFSARREKWTLAMLFIDLDRFKSVNDSLGHPAGDELLNSVAKRLLSSIREADTVARFGGDEFVILIQDITEANTAAIVADKIIQELTRPFSLGEREIFIGASIGITLYPNDADDAASMLRNADMAMYKAKDAGRNRYHFFTSSMQEQVKDQVELEQDLRQALPRGELALHYQPIIHASSRQATKVEALIRWHHPKHGFISPDRFIPLAEETGLIEGIGRWVIETACKEVKGWHDAGYPIGVAINLSGRQRELGFTAEDLSQILTQTRLPVEALTLEITESVLLENSDEVIDWLNAFRDMGISLSMDDFGTGYSSLSYLKRFPIDILKIDRAFIGDITEDNDAASLVVAILAMAESLGLTVVAEGVETERQVSFLVDRQCDYLQGFHFSKPLPALTLLNWLQSEIKVAEPV